MSVSGTTALIKVLVKFFKAAIFLFKAKCSNVIRNDVFHEGDIQIFQDIVFFTDALILTLMLSTQDANTKY